MSNKNWNAWKWEVYTYMADGDRGPDYEACGIREINGGEVIADNLIDWNYIIETIVAAHNKIIDEFAGTTIIL